MGLFDKLFKNSGAITDNSFSPNNAQQAYIVTLWVIITVDGKVSEMESRKIAELSLLKGLLVGFDGIGYIRQVDPILKKSDLNKVIENCAKLIPENEKANLFANAMDIVLSDGDFSSTEAEITQYLAEKLALDLDLAQKIVDVLVIKNQGNIITN